MKKGLFILLVVTAVVFSVTRKPVPERAWTPETAVTIAESTASSSTVREVKPVISGRREETSNDTVKDPRILQARDLIKDGRTEAAISLLREILAATPNDEKALTEIGMVLAHNPKRAEEAATYLKKALVINSENTPAVEELFFLNRDVAKQQGMIDMLRELQKSKPDSVNLNGSIGRALMSQGKDAEAIPFLQKATTGPDASETAGLSLAEIYRQSGDTESALSTYRRVADKNQMELEALKKEGVDTRRFEKEVALNQLNVASMLMEKGETASAERILESVARALPNDPSWEALSKRLQALRNKNG